MTPSEFIKLLLTEPSSAPFTDPSDELSWPCYISHMPDGKGVEDNCGVVYDTAGSVNMVLLDNSHVSDDGFQLSIRSLTYPIGRAKADAAYDYLVGLAKGAVESGFELTNMRLTSTVLAIGLEPGTERRHLFTVNGLVKFKEI
jgi:hypothetical protein